MMLCRVVGNLVSTVKHPAYAGRTLLLCQPIDAAGEPLSDALKVAVDRVQAGVGDRVLVMSEGNGVRQLLGTGDGRMPIRSLVVGIVDEVE
ncbi:MAG: EutN/CcmL family microcompartment protein [Myxococcota bacterium]